LEGARTTLEVKICVVILVIVIGWQKMQMSHLDADLVFRGALQDAVQQESGSNQQQSIGTDL
jgi:hypothetical protein